MYIHDRISFTREGVYRSVGESALITVPSVGETAPYTTLIPVGDPAVGDSACTRLAYPWVNETKFYGRVPFMIPTSLSRFLQHTGKKI